MAALKKRKQSKNARAFDPAALQDFITRLFGGKPPRLTAELIAERRREAKRDTAARTHR
ncbi:MAG: hypothetical protein ACLQME_19795 [Alphaproteobacteria bacterium]